MNYSTPTQIRFHPLTATDKRFGLGYRGLIVRRIKSDEGAWDKAMSARRVPFPDDSASAIKAAKKDSAADWLAKTANTQGARPGRRGTGGCRAWRGAGARIAWSCRSHRQDRS